MDPLASVMVGRSPPYGRADTASRFGVPSTSSDGAVAPYLAPLDPLRPVYAHRADARISRPPGGGRPWRSASESCGCLGQAVAAIRLPMLALALVWGRRCSQGYRRCPGGCTVWVHEGLSWPFPGSGFASGRRAHVLAGQHRSSHWTQPARIATGQVEQPLPSRELGAASTPGSSARRPAQALNRPHATP